MTLPPGTLVGRYEVLQLVRSGRLSEVYRARDISIRRLVAVKTAISGALRQTGSAIQPTTARTGTLAIYVAPSATAVNG